MVSKCYDYTFHFPRSWALPFGGIALLAVYFGYRGATNDRGLILNGLPMSREVATVFYWFVGALLGMPSLIMVLGVFEGRFKRQRITVDAAGLTFPTVLLQSWGRRIMFSEITSIQEMTHGALSKDSLAIGVRTLKLTTASGTCVIAEMRMPSRGDYEELKDLIVSGRLASRATTA